MKIETIHHVTTAAGSVRFVKRDIQPAFIVIVDRFGDQAAFQPYYQESDGIKVYNAMAASLVNPASLRAVQ